MSSERLIEVAAATYVSRLYRDLLRRTPSAVESDVGIAAVGHALNRAAYVSSLANSNECRPFVIIDLSRPLFDGSIDPPLASTALVEFEASDLSIINLAARHYSSERYFEATGRSNGAWLDRLYQRLLGRHPDPNGMLFSLSSLVSKRATREVVTENVFCSPEAHQQRTLALYQRLLGRSPRPEEVETSTTSITNEDIVELICGVATSDEYRGLAAAQPAGAASPSAETSGK